MGEWPGANGLRNVTPLEKPLKMDVLTHKIHQIFDENPELSPEKFNDMPPKEQFQAYNLLRYEIRFRVLPRSGGDTDRLLKEIDQKLSDVLFG